MAISVVSTIDLESIQVITRNVIRLVFSGPVSVTPSLFDPLSYAISSLTHPGNEIAVTSVLPIEEGEGTTEYILLHLIPKAELESSYSITLVSAGTVPSYPSFADLPKQTLFTPVGEPLATMSDRWSHHRTKVDSVLSNLSKMYDSRVGATLFHILTAIGLSDEEIGGDPISRIIT